MSEALIQFSLSALAIVFAGIFLVYSAERIGKLTKLGSLFAGSLLLAGATSLPELLIDINAIKKGMPDLAVGDLMGSSLINLLILAIADLSHRNPNKMFSKAGAKHALSATISLNMTLLACMAILLGKKLEDYVIGQMGIGTLAIILIYIFCMRLVYYEQRSTKSTKEMDIKGRQWSLKKSVVIYLLSGLIIFVVAPFMAESAGIIAKLSGLGDTFIGTTLVAFCTSLPELVSTMTAVRIGAFDLAVGNIFGSNSFNMILLAPLDLVYQGNLLSKVSQSHLLIGLSTMLATCVAVMGQLYQVEKRRKFVEPDALTVIVIVFAAMGMLYWNI